MDSEAAVIRSEMSRTRADLDGKLSELGIRAHELTPRAVAKRYLPENTLDYTIGGILTLVGARMAWKQFRAHRDHEPQTVLVACGGW